MRWLATCCAAAPGAGDEALEKPPGPGEVGGQLLGMTLHRNDKPVIGLHAFHRAVLAFGGLMQARGQASDGLVMEAVDPDLVLAGGVAELGSGIDLDGMGEVASPVTADIVMVEVLDQRASQRNVDDLLTAADAQHGDLLLARLLEKRQLCLVQLTVDRPNLVVLHLSVEGGVDIPSAGEEQAIDVRERGRAGRKLDRLGARGLDGTAIWQVVRLASPRADRDSDFWFFGHPHLVEAPTGAA